MAARVGVGDVVVRIGATYYQGVVTEEIRQDFGRGKVEAGFVVHVQDIRHPDEPWTYQEGPKTSWRRRAPIPTASMRRKKFGRDYSESMKFVDTLLGLLGREPE